MSILNFFKNVSKVGLENAETGSVKLTLDLIGDDAAGAVAIKQKQDEQTIKANMVQEARTEYEKEYAEYESALAIYNRFKNEAKAAVALLENPGDNNVDDINKDLTFLIGKLEEYKPILEKEKTEAEEAKQWLNEAEEALSETTKQLVLLEDTLNKSKRDLKAAELAAEREARKLKQAEILAGLEKSGSKYDTVIDSINKKAAEIQKKADIAKLKTESLTKAKVSDGEEVLGKYTTAVEPTETSESIKDRLAKFEI